MNAISKKRKTEVSKHSIEIHKTHVEGFARLFIEKIIIDGKNILDANYLIKFGSQIMDAGNNILIEEFQKEQEEKRKKKFNRGVIKAKPEAIKIARKGYVYLMFDKHTKYYKIGFSKDPKYREKTLQAEKPTIILMHKFKGTMRDEKRLHKKYDSKRIRGEWFDLTQENVNYINSL